MGTRWAPLALGLLLASCAATGEPSSGESGVVDGKADTGRRNDSVVKRMCLALGAGDGCDPCQELGAYDDDACDRSPICHRADPACIDCTSFSEMLDECVDNSGSLVGCFPLDRDVRDPFQYDEARACCEGEGICELTDPSVRLYASRLPLPEGLSTDEGSSAVVGHMRVATVEGERFTDAALHKAFARGRMWFGNEYDGVLVDDGHLGFEHFRSADAFLAFLRDDTASWDGRLSDAAIDALDRHLTSTGKWDVEVYMAMQDFETYWGRGSTSHILVWNRADDHVIYLVLHPTYEHTED